MTDIESLDAEPSASSPWRKRMVHRGLVYFKGMRYTSIELHALWGGLTNGGLMVLVKPVAESSSYLIWKPDEGPAGLLTLTGEDACRFGDLSWNEIDMVFKRELAIASQPKLVRRISAPTRK
ncbi:hypothetical protein [Caballeronia sp. BR00000012568055]|uniref:hypothetical protein n=1 Tax=Caballeronia sp. BR00000012568055 TaxID=2918761 RepID=UPI0023F75D6C|nr:hypothetical protein [Caballeronia sp. BR00000012568055]